MKRNANKAVGRYIELNLDKEDIIMTMMQHLENKFVAKGIQKGEQVGAEKEKLNIAKSMLLAGEDENKVAACTGLDFDVVVQIKSSMTH